MNPIQRLDGLQIDIDFDFPRRSVEDGIAELLITECGVEPEDIFRIAVEQEHHVEVGRTENGALITEPEAFTVYVETTDHRATVVVNRDGIIRAEEK